MSNHNIKRENLRILDAMLLIKREILNNETHLER